MAKDVSVTIFHNPNCGTSRNVLAALKDAGVKPNVVEYLKAGWTRPQLKGLLASMHAKPRDILRTRGASEAALAKVGPAASDEAILDAMVADPILVERPIVVTPKGTALCRPAERLQALL
jgi:arsenate reductase (glutaredoxin)